VNAKGNRIPPPVGHSNNGVTNPASLPAPLDPIDAANHLWALRLWIVCALIIISYAVVNYLLNWFV
jgi:hypothetical protein